MISQNDYPHSVQLGEIQFILSESKEHSLDCQLYESFDGDHAIELKLEKPATDEVLNQEIFYRFLAAYGPQYLGEQEHMGKLYHVLEHTCFSLEDYIEDYVYQNGMREKQSVIINLSLKMLAVINNLHECGFVHMRMGPETFRVTQEGEVKLVDIDGVASYVSGGRHKESETNG